MSNKQHGRGNQPDDKDRDRQQMNVEQNASSSALESKILARLGLGGNGTEEWQKEVRTIERLAEKGEPDAVESISSYLNAATSSHEAVRMAAIRGLLKLEKRYPGLVPLRPFIEALNDQHPQVRALAVEALTAYGVRRLPDAVLNYLKNMLKNGSGDEQVRMMIIPLLVSLGKDAPIDLLVTALHDEHWQVREAAVLALGTFMKQNRLSQDQHEQLELMLYDDDDFVREAVLLVLRDQWPELRPQNDLRTSESERRVQAARVLGEMGDSSSETLDALYAIVRDPQANSQLREAALLTLAELHAPLDDATLKRLLDDTDQSVREAALVLGHMTAPDRYPMFEDESDTVEPAPDNVIKLEGRKRTRNDTPKDNDHPGA